MRGCEAAAGDWQGHPGEDKAAGAGRAHARSGGARVGGENESRKPEGGGAPSSVVFVWV